METLDSRLRDTPMVYTIGNDGFLDFERHLMNLYRG
jgi:hypothetical protein